MTLKATSLQDLAPVRRALAEAAAQEALLQQQRAEAARRLLAEQKLFENTVGPVHALKSAHARHLHAPEPPSRCPCSWSWTSSACCRRP